jgi:hypothetical protein
LKKKNNNDLIIKNLIEKINISVEESYSLFYIFKCNVKIYKDVCHHFNNLKKYEDILVLINLFKLNFSKYLFALEDSKKNVVGITLKPADLLKIILNDEKIINLIIENILKIAKFEKKNVIEKELNIFGNNFITVIIDLKNNKIYFQQIIIRSADATIFKDGEKLNIESLKLDSTQKLDLLFVFKICRYYDSYEENVFINGTSNLDWSLNQEFNIINNNFFKFNLKEDFFENNFNLKNFKEFEFFIKFKIINVMDVLAFFNEISREKINEIKWI